jgi:hypothetical protein
MEHTPVKSSRLSKRRRSPTQFCWRAAQRTANEGRGKNFGRVATAGMRARVVHSKVRVNRKVRAYALSIHRRANPVQNIYGTVSPIEQSHLSRVQMLDYLHITEALTMAEQLSASIQKTLELASSCAQVKPATTTAL